MTDVQIFVVTIAATMKTKVKKIFLKLSLKKILKSQKIRHLRNPKIYGNVIEESKLHIIITNESFTPFFSSYLTIIMNSVEIVATSMIQDLIHRVRQAKEVCSVKGQSILVTVARIIPMKIYQFNPTMVLYTIFIILLFFFVDSVI